MQTMPRGYPNARIASNIMPHRRERGFNVTVQTIPGRKLKHSTTRIEIRKECIGWQRSQDGLRNTSAGNLRPARNVVPAGTLGTGGTGHMFHVSVRRKALFICPTLGVHVVREWLEPTTSHGHEIRVLDLPPFLYRLLQQRFPGLDKIAHIAKSPLMISLNCNIAKTSFDNFKIYNIIQKVMCFTVAKRRERFGVSAELFQRR